MLKSSESTKSLTQPEEDIIGVGSDSRTGHEGNKPDESELNGAGIDDSEVEVDEVEKNIQKRSKSKKTVRSSDFFTCRAKLAFTKLRQAFFKAPILHHFDLERHIRIETDVSGYAIGRVLSQLTLDDLGQWHSVAFFFARWFQQKPGTRRMTVSF